MATMEFGDFLDKMTGNYTEKKKKTQTESKKTKRPKGHQTTKEFETKRKPINEKKEKEISMPKNNDSTSDDIVVKALDYSTRFLKIIYQNFKDEKERKIVLQSIKATIDLALGGQGTTPQNIAKQVQAQPQPQPQQKQPTNQNENIELHMNDLSGQEVDIKPQDSGSGYNRNLNLGLKVGNDGKQEVDLSRVSQKEMHEMMVLAGVDENQKKKEKAKQPLNEEQIKELENGE